MAKDAAELLSEIQSLMNQYLALPGDTPLKGAFQDVLPQVEDGVKSLHHGGADNAPDPESPEEDQAEGDEEPGDSGFKSYKDASHAALKDMHDESGGPRRGIPPQFANRKKKTKAPAS